MTWKSLAKCHLYLNITWRPRYILFLPLYKNFHFWELLLFILKLICIINFFFMVVHMQRSLFETYFDKVVKCEVVYMQQLLWHCIHTRPLFPSFLVFRLLWFCWCSWCFPLLFLCLCPFLQAYPEFVLTYLEELNEERRWPRQKTAFTMGPGLQLIRR